MARPRRIATEEAALGCTPDMKMDMRPGHPSLEDSRGVGRRLGHLTSLSSPGLVDHIQGLKTLPSQVAQSQEGC